MPVVFRGSFLNPTWRDAMKTWEAKMPGPLLTHRRQISELVWIPAGGLSADDHKHWDCLKIRTIKIPSFIYNVWYILYMDIHVYLYHLFEWSSSHENYHLAVSRQTQIGFDLIPHDLRELTNLEDVSKQPVWRFSIQSIRICACTGFSDFCWVNPLNTTGFFHPQELDRCLQWSLPACLVWISLISLSYHFCLSDVTAITAITRSCFLSGEGRPRSKLPNL